ncbi:hypothetical protein NX059_010559 [Plenodomus lindquistii]|nr:hypothetical protein NX059_010559 [Plenodomus lindquistii]
MLPDSMTATTTKLVPQFLDTQLYTPGANSVFFQDQEEAEGSMANCLWRAPENDPTIPTSSTDDRRIVKQIFDAMKDVSEANETPGSANLKRFTPVPHYKDWALELCAWDVLIHLEGFRCRLYDVTLIGSISETRNWCFQHRINVICFVLKRSKTATVNLMKKEKIITLVGAPHKLAAGIYTNSNSNANRAVWVINGRDADKEHQNGVRKPRHGKDRDKLPLPKRHMRNNEGTAQIEHVVKKIKSSRLGNSSRDASSSPPVEPVPSPSPLATGAVGRRHLQAMAGTATGPPSALPSLNHGFVPYQISNYPPFNYQPLHYEPLAYPPHDHHPNISSARASLATVPARDYNKGNDSDVAEAPNLPFRSLSLGAINGFLHTSRPISEGHHNGDTHIKCESDSGDGPSVGSPSVAIRTLGHSHNLTHASPAADRFDGDTEDATDTTTRRSAPKPAIKVKPTEGTHDPATIDAARALASMQQESTA